jgi:hypothetical protein
MISQIPQVLYKNRIADILEKIRQNYGLLTRKGYIYGIMAIDQDAKIIAVDPRFDRNLNYWDLSSIGAALHSIARQGQEFFDADCLDRATIIYNNMRLFVKSVLSVNINRDGNTNEKREVIIILLSDNDVNIGVAVLQMERYAEKLREEIESSGSITNMMKMNEKELKKHIQELKKEVFGSKISQST